MAGRTIACRRRGVARRSLLPPPPFSDLSPSQDLAEALARPLKLPGVNGLRAVFGFKRYRESLAQSSAAALEPLVLSAAERSLVAGRTVDVYPWEAAYVAANQLTWANRPSTSSVNAHSETIDRLNAAFFASTRRPQRLLWHRTDTHSPRPEVTSVASIDGRHLFWDEPLFTCYRSWITTSWSAPAACSSLRSGRNRASWQRRCSGL